MQTVTSKKLLVGIQGAANTGKTWAALTFPNPVVADFDNGLTSKMGENVIAIPFWSDSYCVDVLGAKITQGTSEGIPTKVVNKRDAFRKWLSVEGIKLEADQTLLVDSWTTLQNAFDAQTELEPVYTKNGSVDDFAFWKRKIMWSTDVLETLKGLACHVVVIFHEIQQRDKVTGLLLDKVKPLMQGQFVAELPIYFSDFFRQHCFHKMGRDGKPTLVNGKPLDKDISYWWQIKSDSQFDAKSRLKHRPEAFVPATYESFS